MLRMPDTGSSSALLQQHKVEDLSTSGYGGSCSKRPRTSEDFLRFCDVVLTYANYPGDFRASYLHQRDHDHPRDHKHRDHQREIQREREMEREEGQPLDLKAEAERLGGREEGRRAGRKLESPLNSVGESVRGSTRSSTSSTHSDSSLDVDIETPEYDESWSMVTCWCGKPFAGRPMIECESCLVWLHLSCARVRKTHIPKHFKCARCKPPKGRPIKSPPSPASS